MGSFCVRAGAGVRAGGVTGGVPGISHRVCRLSTMRGLGCSGKGVRVKVASRLDVSIDGPGSSCRMLGQGNGSAGTECGEILRVGRNCPFEIGIDGCAACTGRNGVGGRGRSWGINSVAWGFR